jgi:hypothetical protein
MKKLFSTVLMLLVVAITTNSCQNDSNSKELNKNSTLTTLLMRVTHGGVSAAGKLMRGGEHAPCFTVNLPVTLVDAAGQSTVVSDMSQYDLVLHALHNRGDHDGGEGNGGDGDGEDDDDNDGDHSHASFVYPISLTMADGTTLAVATQEELQAAVHSCNDDLDDIDCMELHYPITINYSDANNIATTVTFNSDDDIYTFLATLGASETMVINYPMTITDANGGTVTVNSNEELQAAIEAAAGHCGHHEGEGDHDGDHDGDGDKG